MQEAALQVGRILSGAPFGARTFKTPPDCLELDCNSRSFCSTIHITSTTSPYDREIGYLRRADDTWISRIRDKRDTTYSIRQY